MQSTTLQSSSYSFQHHRHGTILGQWARRPWPECWMLPADSSSCSTHQWFCRWRPCSITQELFSARIGNQCKLVPSNLAIKPMPDVEIRLFPIGYFARSKFKEYKIDFDYTDGYIRAWAHQHFNSQPRRGSSCLFFTTNKPWVSQSHVDLVSPHQFALTIAVACVMNFLRLSLARSISTISTFGKFHPRTI